MSITLSQFLNLTSYDEPAPGSPLCSRYSERARRGGGAVYGFDSTITVNECNFTRNTVLCGGGGAILVENTRLRINNSRFTENTASIIGGAVYAYGNVTEIHSSIFNYNSVTGMSRSAQPVLSKGGGAIFVSSPSSKISIDTSTFNANSGASGGALHVYGNNTDISVRQSQFINNTALGGAGEGGAIYYNGQRSNVKVVESVFESNAASKCATIRLEDLTNTTDITALDNYFTNNTANESGGFICLSGNYMYTTLVHITTSPATDVGISTTGSTTVTKKEAGSTTEARVSVGNSVTTTATLVVVIILCVLVAILYLMVAIVTLCLCSMIKGKLGKVSNPNVYVPMVEAENSNDDQNS